MDELVMARALTDEIEKIAVGARMGNIIGGVLGAGAGATTGYLAAPEEMKTRAAILGGLGGGVLGLGGGQLATQAGRHEVAQFGRRQLHGMTGYLPGRGILGRGPEGTDWYRIGTKGPELSGAQRLSKLKEMDFDIPEAATREEALGLARTSIGEGMLTSRLPKNVQEFLAKRRASRDWHQRRLMEAGGTSLPGLGKALAGQSGLSPYEAMKSNVLSQGLVPGVVLPAGMLVPSVLEARESGDTSQLKKDIGATLGFGLSGVTPIGATMALGQMGSLAGGLVNRVTG